MVKLTLVPAVSDDQPPAVAPSDLLTVEEAAAELRIGRTKAYALINAGELGSLTIGARRFVTRAMIAAYRAARERATPPPHAARRKRAAK